MSISIIVEIILKERVGRFDSENISVTIDLRRRRKITPNLVELEQEYTDNMMLEYNNRFILNLAKNEDIISLGQTICDSTYCSRQSEIISLHSIIPQKDKYGEYNDQ